MEKRSKILITIFFIITIISVIITLYRYMIREDIEYYIDEEAFNEALLEDLEEE